MSNRDGGEEAAHSRKQEPTLRSSGLHKPGGCEVQPMQSHIVALAERSALPGRMLADHAAHVDRCVTSLQGPVKEVHQCVADSLVDR